MGPWMIFWLSFIGMITIYKIIEQITYCICWLKSDVETRMRMLEKGNNKINKENK